MKRFCWLYPLFLASCVPLTHSPIGKTVSLLVYPRVATKTQAMIPQNDLNAIAILDIVPYVQDASGSYQPISSITGNPTTVGAADMLKLSQSSPSIDPNRPIVLRSLKPNKNYRIFGRAYNTSNAIISQDNASYVDVVTGNDDRPGMATLPVSMVAVPFAATTSVNVITEGRFDYLKTTLYLVASNSQMAISSTTRSNPNIVFGNLQGNTNYRLVVEAYKLGVAMASNSVNINITNENAPTTTTLALSVPYVVSTLAGNGNTTFADGLGTAATLFRPFNLSVDPAGNVYVPEHGGHRIRKITPSGTVSTVIGNGTGAYTEGTGTNAQVSQATGVFAAPNGNLYIVDHGNQRIRKMNAQGVTSFVAGNGIAGFADGTGTAASFNWASTLVQDSQGNLIVTDQLNHRIRKIDSNGAVTTLAGNGNAAFADGQGTAASFYAPIGIAIDPQDNLYIGDNLNQRIRKITPTGLVSTIAGNGITGTSDGTGTAAQFNSPQGIALDTQGNLYVAEYSNHRIRKISSTGVVTTIAGTGATGFADGIGTCAIFNAPWGIAIDGGGNLYVAERDNHRVRKLQ